MAIIFFVGGLIIFVMPSKLASVYRSKYKKNQPDILIG